MQHHISFDLIFNFPFLYNAPSLALVKPLNVSSSIRLSAVSVQSLLNRSLLARIQVLNRSKMRFANYSKIYHALLFIHYKLKFYTTVENGKQNKLYALYTSSSERNARKNFAALNASTKVGHFKCLSSRGRTWAYNRAAHGQFKMRHYFDHFR